MAGGNPESSAPLGACRQEVGSLHQEGKSGGKSGEVSCCVEPAGNRSCGSSLATFVSPGIWNGLPGSELDGEWGKVALLLPLPGEFG